MQTNGLHPRHQVRLQPRVRCKMYSTIPAETVAGAAQMMIYVVTAVALFVSLTLTARWAS